MIQYLEFKIIGQFVGELNKEIYGRDFAKKNKINNKTTATALNKLEKQGILKSVRKGKTKCFKLNKENANVSRYLICSEILKSIEFLDKNLKIKEILSGENIIGLFGSYVKGYATNKSDLDLFCFEKIDEKKLKSKGKKYGLNLSIHKISKPNFKKMLKENSPLIKEIIKDHILINEYEYFIKEVIKNEWN